jgi:hypothetical protein
MRELHLYLTLFLHKLLQANVKEQSILDKIKRKNWMKQGYAECSKKKKKRHLKRVNGGLALFTHRFFFLLG